MDIKKKHSLSLAIIALLSCCLLLAGACENAGDFGTERPSAEQSGDVLLSLTADIVPPVVSETRAVNPIEGFTGTEYSFGLSITRDNDTKEETFSGSSNMTAIMKRGSTSSNKWTWVFQNSRGITIDGSAIRVPAGKPLRIIAYYPHITGANVFTDGIPFDFTGTIKPLQEEILYNTDTTCTVAASADNKAVVPLTFQHAYSRIVINITKYLSGGTYNLTNVSIENLSDEWIKNKGSINPATGLCMPGATAGPIGETRAPEPIYSPGEQGATTRTYEFLVPAFMDSSVKNENIIITMMINGIKEVFPLERRFLNSENGKYGFRQGYKNTYNIVFDNSAMSLRLLNWKSTVITEDFGTAETFSGEIGVVEYGDKLGNFTWNESLTGLKPSLFTYDKSLYDNYLSTVAYGNNGAYVTENPLPQPPVGGTKYICEDDQNVQGNENVYVKTWITQKDVSEASVPWEDENGQLVAKELCRKYRGGGYNDWRLPRASEFRGFMVFTSYNGTTGNMMGLLGSDRRRLFWTATEVDETHAWTASYYNDVADKGAQYKGPLLYSQDKKKVKAFVRCVRIPNSGENPSSSPK